MNAFLTKEGAKKGNLSRSATSPSCDASMQKEKEKNRERENEVSLPVTD